MKKSLLILALGLSAALNNAYAATYDATPSGDGYLFSSSFSGTVSFDDYVYFNTEATQSLIASISGTGSQAFSFQSFNLLDENKNLLQVGSVINPATDPNIGGQVSFGFLQSIQKGDYYLHIVGNSVGATAGYSGTISLTAVPVPEPETYAMFLAGLGIAGLVSRKKMRKNA